MLHRDGAWEPLLSGDTHAHVPTALCPRRPPAGSHICCRLCWFPTSNHSSPFLYPECCPAHARAMLPGKTVWSKLTRWPYSPTWGSVSICPGDATAGQGRDGELPGVGVEGLLAKGLLVDERDRRGGGELSSLPLKAVTCSGGALGHLPPWRSGQPDSTRLGADTLSWTLTSECPFRFQP